MTKHKFPETDGVTISFINGKDLIAQQGGQMTPEQLKAALMAVTKKSTLEGGEDAVQESQGGAESPFLAADYFESLPRAVRVAALIEPDKKYRVTGVTSGGTIPIDAMGHALTEAQEDDIVSRLIAEMRVSGTTIERSPERSREKSTASRQADQDLIDMQDSISKHLTSMMGVKVLDRTNNTVRIEEE